MEDDKLRGKYLASLRKSKGLKQVDLAELLHYTDKNISKWENGKSFPTDPDILTNLANVLDTTVDDLVYGYNKDNKIDKKSNFKIFNKNYFKFNNTLIVLFILLCFFLNYLLLCKYDNYYYAFISNENISSGYINIQLNADLNNLRFYKLKSTNKNIKLVSFYYEIDNQEKLLFESENEDVHLIEYTDFLEFDFYNIVKSNCYIKIIYNDEEVDIINIKFKKVI